MNICALGFALAGCQVRQECRARGDVTTYAGAASVASATTGAGVAFSSTMVPARVVVDDYTSDCVYDGMTFPVTLGACTLTLQAADVKYDRAGVFTEGNARLAAPTTCTLDVGGTMEDVTIDEAFFDLTDTMQFVMTGTLANRAASTVEGTSAFSYSFTGDKE